MSTVKNETLKLIANWFNAASVVVLGTGVVVPSLAKYYPQGSSDPVDLNWGLTIVCIVVAVSLHLIGQAFLGALDE